MNQIDVISHGRTPKTHGSKISFFIALLGAICLLNPFTTQAAGAAMTQLEFIQWVASVTGDSGQFGPSASSGDFIQWARNKGMNPDGGWQADAVMTTDALAQVMVQLFDLNPKKFGGDMKKNLLREGIVLPESPTVTRLSLMAFVDQLGMTSRIPTISSNPHTPGNPPSGFANPNNPHTVFNPGSHGIGQAHAPGQIKKNNP